MTRIQRFAVLLPLVMVASALAENGRVCMGGDIEQLSPVQMQACRSEVQQVREVVAKYHADAWHFVVVCDDISWKDYAAFSTLPSNVLESATADANLPLRTTFFRGAHWNQVLAENVLTTQITAAASQQVRQIALNRVGNSQ